MSLSWANTNRLFYALQTWYLNFQNTYQTYNSEPNVDNLSYVSGAKNLAEEVAKLIKVNEDLVRRIEQLEQGYINRPQ